VTPRPGELESVACNLCGSTAAEPVYDFSPLHIVRCRVCDLVYTSPRLTQSEIESRLYGPDYWEAYERQYVEALPAIREFARHWLTTLGRFAASDRWRLFELGPGLGAFLAEARDAGHEVYGADISEHAIARARERFGLEVVHLPDPLAALRTAHEQLVPGGLLFLSTGVFGSFNQRFAGKRWGIIEPEAHLYYFSKDTIRQALELAGFDLLLLETNELLVNPTTRSLLAPLFNNRVTQFLRFGALVRRLRLGDEMFVVTRKRS
jgi:SAM-dependent methyltransferase